MVCSMGVFDILDHLSTRFTASEGPRTEEGRPGMTGDDRRCQTEDLKKWFPGFGLDFQTIHVWADYTQLNVTRMVWG